MAFILRVAYNKVFKLLTAVRGYHYYKRFWIPQKDQILECFFETHNPFDHFAIKECKVGNGNAQGGIEVACKVTVKIPGTCINILLMEKYKQLVQQLYIEPKNGEILGSYLQANETIDGVEAQQVWKKAKRKRKKTNKTVNRQNEIYHFFKKQGIITNTETLSKRPSVITIDE